MNPGCAMEAHIVEGKGINSGMKYAIPVSVELAYQCDVCKKYLKDMNTLRTHSLTHSEDRPFVCTWDGCEDSFKTKGSMKRHMRRHTGDRPFVCELCNRSFRESGALTRHLKAITPCTRKGDTEYPMYGKRMSVQGTFVQESDVKHSTSERTADVPVNSATVQEVTLETSAPATVTDVTLLSSAQSTVSKAIPTSFVMSNSLLQDSPLKNGDISVRYVVLNKIQTNSKSLPAVNVLKTPGIQSDVSTPVTLPTSFSPGNGQLINNVNPKRVRIVKVLPRNAQLISQDNSITLTTNRNQLLHGESNLSAHSGRVEDSPARDSVSSVCSFAGSPHQSSNVNDRDNKQTLLDSGMNAPRQVSSSCADIISVESVNVILPVSETVINDSTVECDINVSTGLEVATTDHKQALLPKHRIKIVRLKHDSKLLTDSIANNNTVVNKLSSHELKDNQSMGITLKLLETEHCGKESLMYENDRVAHDQEKTMTQESSKNYTNESMSKNQTEQSPVVIETNWTGQKLIKLSDANGSVAEGVVISTIKESEVHVTQGDMEVTQGDMEVTQCDMEVTQGDMDITQGDMDITQGDMDATPDNADVTQDNLDVTQTDINVAQSDVQLTQGDDVTLTLTGDEQALERFEIMKSNVLVTQQEEVVTSALLKVSDTSDDVTSEDNVIARTDVVDNCQACQQSYDDVTELKLHLKSHLKTAGYKCPVLDCKCLVPGRRELMLHLEVVHRIIERDEHCADDILTSNDINPETANVALKQLLELQGNLDTEVHTLGEHQVKVLHACPVCYRTFTLHYLKMHIRVHTGERPHVCKQCRKSFRTRDTLSKHAVTHSTQRLFKCGECSKTFKRISHVKEHLKVHTNDRQYNCTMCDKAFKTANACKVHMRTHEDSLPHDCSICNRAFREKSAMERHMRTHTGEKPYKCRKCGRGFAEHGTLNRHLRAKVPCVPSLNYKYKLNNRQEIDSNSQQQQLIHIQPIPMRENHDIVFQETKSRQPQLFEVSLDSLHSVSNVLQPVSFATDTGYDVTVVDSGGADVVIGDMAQDHTDVLTQFSTVAAATQQYIFQDPGQSYQVVEIADTEIS